MYTFFFFNDTATTEIYTLSLHDALPISLPVDAALAVAAVEDHLDVDLARKLAREVPVRSEEHTSELQSPCNLVCRLLLEKKKKKQNQNNRKTRSHTATLRTPRSSRTRPR